MSRHNQDPHDWLTAQFDDDDLDDENAGTDAADADAVDSNASTGASFSWGLRPAASPIERQPDVVVPESFFPALKAERPAVAPNAAALQAVANHTAAPLSSSSSSSSSSPLAAAPAPVSAVMSAVPPQPPQSARPFYPPPPAISRPTQRGSEPLADPFSPPFAEPFAEPVSALEPSVPIAPSVPIVPIEPIVPIDQDGGEEPAMSIAEVLDAPSPRRAAREAAAREAAAREAATRDDIAAAQAGAEEPDDDGIDDLVSPRAPLTPQAYAPLTPAVPVVPPKVAVATNPVRAAGVVRFDVPIVPTTDRPKVAGRAQSVASREASTRAAPSHTRKILLLVGIVLVVALAIVLTFRLAQPADAAPVTGALDVAVVLAEAVVLAGF